MEQERQWRENARAEAARWQQEAARLRAEAEEQNNMASRRVRSRAADRAERRAEWMQRQADS